MKFAICNETFENWPFEKAFSFIKECGYTGVEIAPFTISKSVYDIPKTTRDDIRNQIVDAGLECVGLHWLLAKTEGYYLTSPNKEIQKATGDYLAELGRFCGELNGTIMVLGSPAQRNLLPGVTHEQALEFAARTIGRAMPVLEEHGVTLALEPLSPKEGNFLNTAAQGIELAKMIDSPNCRLHLDVKAMSSESAPIDHIIRESAEFLAHFHANDSNLLGPGMGEIKFEPIFKALHEVAYRGWISVEVFDYKPGAEYISRESIAYMKKIAAKVVS